MFIFLFNVKNTIENRKLNFLPIICKIQKKRKNAEFFPSIMSKNFCLAQFLIKCIFFVLILKNKIKIKEFHIFRLDLYLMFWFLKNTIENLKFHLLTKVCEIENKR